MLCVHVCSYKYLYKYHEYTCYNEKFMERKMLQVMEKEKGEWYYLKMFTEHPYPNLDPDTY
jgi:hypothetical protein